MPKRLNVLMAEASAANAERIAEALRRDGYDIGMERVQRAAEMVGALDRQHWDLILANDALPGFDALAVMRVLRERAQAHARSGDLPPVIVLTAASSGASSAASSVASPASASASGSASPSALREAIREGARDFVSRDDLPRLLIAIERELRDRDLRDSQRAADANLQQAQKLDAVAQLAGGVAHDFNNLLTAILAYSDSLLYQLPPDSPLRTELTEIKKSGERASALTQRLLAFGGRRPFKPSVTNVNALIASLEQTLRRMLGEHVDVILQLAPDVGPVRVDVAQLEQAILNLASNARDAMPAGGTLTLRTANVDPRAAASVSNTANAAQNGYVSLTITDTGCGMDASTQARAFEPFFTTRETGQGSGLGLPMVYGTITQAGGSISVESEVGRGTAMQVLLPRAQAEASTSPLPSGHETILLVEDDELVRQMAGLTLERRGYQVLIARDGTEAVSRAQAHAGEIHLLIADFVMPRVDGQELARALRQARPGLRVLHMIGYGDEALAKESVAADPHTSFLQKPFVATALVDRVRDALVVAVAAGRSPGRTGG
jgi:two-component system cell cycle sensor histidine kinase/response regulator CckA